MWASLDDCFPISHCASTPTTMADSYNPLRGDHPFAALRLPPTHPLYRAEIWPNITADTATQAGPEPVNLTAPKADVTLQNGTWLMVQSRDGVYMQHAGQLDLSHDVLLYRQDGTTMTSQTADVDLRQGAASSDQPTHAEGPFGVLDAPGFALVDKGAVVQFPGPAHLLLNGAVR